MSSRLLFLAGLLACIGAGCQDPEGARLVLSFPNFKPGCIRVSIADAGGAGSALTKEIEGPLATKTSGDELIVAVRIQEGWSERLTFTATAFEQKCGQGPGFTTDKTVDVGRSAVEVRLTFEAMDADRDGYVSRGSGGSDCADNEATVNPGQQELCNNRDDNCDNRADEGFERAGQQCGTVGACQIWACNAEGALSCQAGLPRWYRDQDGDGEGTAQDSKDACTQPTGYVSNSRDCDDNNRARYSTATELCDTLDNNCNGTKDEGFDVGAACSAGNDCTGTKACTAAKTATECKAPSPTQYYVDNDQDGYGQNLGPLTCNTPAGYATRGGDCKDGNFYTHPGAPELCDREDNDCDAATSETSVCPVGGASWTSFATDTADTWRSVALYNNGGVWIAGGDKLHLRRAGQLTFDDLSACASGEDVYGIATDRSTGNALLGGNSGFLARYYLATTGCTDKGRLSIDTDVRGAHLVPFQDKLETILIGVNTRVVINRGRVVRVLDNHGTGYKNEEISYELKDVNGPSRDLMFAVGGPLTGTPSSHIYRFNPATGNWTEESVPAGGGVLNGVWVVNSKLAYAVGDSGTLLTWNGTAWSKVTGGPSDNFSAVVAFGTQSLYVTTLNGKLHYYNGTTWTVLLSTSAVQLLDIAANNPGDIWVVGSKGTRYHWPQ